MLRSPRSPRRLLGLTLAVLAPVVVSTTAAVGTAHAKGADECDGGGYTLVNLSTGAVIASAASGEVDASIPAASFGDRSGVRGRYNEFDVTMSDFAVLDYTFTGAPNPEDMTGGQRTPVFASKQPDHRGAVLSGPVVVELDEDGMNLERDGAAISMKIQAKDCAQGGIFQMEPERADGTTTRITHTLANPGGPLTPFYFDNPNFRARVGQFLGDDCVSVETGPPSRFCVQVSTRVNIANDASDDFVARDSAQVATRVTNPACNTATPVTPSVAHCGGVSVWDVASGGRMGFVTGEDAVEVANPPTNCTQNCQAQNRVRGRLAVLDFPFPVPAGSRLVPRIA